MAQQSVDAAVESLAGNNAEIKKDLYSVVADIMPWIIETTGGDEVKMQKMVEEARSNPEAFQKRLPQHLQAKLAEVTRKVEVQRKTANPGP